MILTPATTVREKHFDDETLELAMRELLSFLTQSPGVDTSGQGEIKRATQ